MLKISEMDNERLEAEVAGVQGWIIAEDVNPDPTIFGQRLYWTSVDGGEGEYVDMYHPCSDTPEAKAQCFDLMKKYELDVDFFGEIILIKYKKHVLFHGNAQRAICEAVLIYKGYDR